MPGQRLVIEADDLGRFFLIVQDGELSIGTGPDDGQVLFRNLHVGRIRCEVEVEDNALVLHGLSGDKEFRPGQTAQVGGSHVSLVGVAPAPLAEPEPGGLIRRLVVTDGADLGRSYPLPASGVMTIGNSQKHAGFVLHDLYVARVHCELQVEGERVTVTHRESARGTLINGQRITVQELHLGDVLRVGNSHLRYELSAAVDPPDGAGDPQAAPIAVASAGGSGRPAARASSSDPLLELENQVFGQYQLGGLLGRGRSGVSFRASHRQTHQAVSLKVLSPDFPHGEDELQGFVRALKVIAPLRHPHLVPILGAGKVGVHYWIAREYVEGENLGTLIERLTGEGKLGWKRACRVAVHLGKVLDYLEQHKVRHGQLTLPNILIETESRTTRLGDVMLDKVLDRTSLDGAGRERQLAEAPYRAPEESEAGAGADHRASLYSLGAVLYALLTGKPPFTGVSAEAIASQAREGKVAKPSKVLRDTPAPFEAAVLKLMALQPEDRFQTAAEMLAAVEPIAYMHEIKV